MQLFVTDRRRVLRGSKEACSLFILDKGLPSATAGRKASQPSYFGNRVGGVAERVLVVWLEDRRIFKPNRSIRRGREGHGILHMS
jgi:hypothetical protein